MSVVFEEYCFIVGGLDEGQCIDVFFVVKFKWGLCGWLCRLIEEGCVEFFESEGGSFDECCLKLSLCLCYMQEVVFCFDVKLCFLFSFVEVLVQIVYEDVDLLVFNKVFGVLFYFNQSYLSGLFMECVYCQVCEFCELLCVDVFDVDWMLLLCYCFDCDMSGFVVLVKNFEFCVVFGLQFEECILSKIYVVVVNGLIEDEGIIDVWFGLVFNLVVELCMVMRLDG